MIQRLTAGWNRFWFTPQSALTLGICRVLFFGGLLYQCFRKDWSVWGKIGELFWFPTPLFRALHLPLLDSGLLRVLTVIWLLSLALACVGFATRLSTLVAAVLGFYLLGLPHNFGKVHHNDALIVFVLVAMAISHCGDHGSIDAWLRRRRGVQRPAQSGEYHWPVRFVWVVWVIVYFAAGISKLRTAGLEWVFSDSFRNILIEHHYTTHPLVDWGLTIAEYPTLCRVLAAGSLLTELLSPTALFWPRARQLFVPALCSMQFGIWLVLGVKFAPFLLIVAFWIPWDELLSLLRSRRGPIVDGETSLD